MSATPVTNPLSFDELIARYRWHFSCLPDARVGLNTTYKVADVAAAAFSVFFMQQPSFLAYQRLMSKKYNRSNVQSLFGVSDIPSDNQIRNILDPLAPTLLTPLYDGIMTDLLTQGYLAPYKHVNDTYLIAMDGTQFFSSNKIHCGQCYRREYANGEVNYSHTAVTPVFVRPGSSSVISLPVEYITPQDGHDKQDSETAASKRWLQTHAHKYSAYGCTILGDDLYSRQPMCEAVLAEKLHFIFTCKEDSHSTLYEWVNEITSMNKVSTLQVMRRDGKKKYIDHYRFINTVPIRDGADALMVNWCELKTVNEQGETVFYNTFITNHEITGENVADIVRAGRARWHVENGHNNVVKTKGYHATHNFGHGKKHLCALLLTLNLLAFLFHTVLDLIDTSYQLIRKEVGTRKAFFDHLYTLTIYMLFTSWQHLMQFMMERLEIVPYDTT